MKDHIKKIKMKIITENSQNYLNLILTDYLNSGYLSNVIASFWSHRLKNTLIFIIGYVSFRFAFSLFPSLWIIFFMRSTIWYIYWTNIFLTSSFSNWWITRGKSEKFVMGVWLKSYYKCFEAFDWPIKERILRIDQSIDQSNNVSKNL